MTLNHEWRRFAMLFGASLVVCALGFLWKPGSWNLILLYLYSIPSNSIIPIPHEPAMIFFGRLHPPLVVAVVAVAGTMVPCFLDYQAINRAFQTERLRKVRESDIYHGAVAYFLKAPFLSIVVAAFAPFIPFYIFRVLAPTGGYPLRRYMLAMAIGRLPRYYLFALMGNALAFPELLTWGAVILIACTGLFLLVKQHLASIRPSTEVLPFESSTPRPPSPAPVTDSPASPPKAS